MLPIITIEKLVSVIHFFKYLDNVLNADSGREISILMLTYSKSSMIIPSSNRRSSVLKTDPSPGGLNA